MKYEVRALSSGHNAVSTSKVTNITSLLGLEPTSSEAFSDTQLTFAWWNVSYRPPVASKPDPVDKSVLRPWFMYCQLDELLSLDLMAFGEISSSFMKSFENLAEARGMAGVDISGPDGRLIHDIGIFYKPSKLKLLNYNNITKSHYSGRLKIATRFDFEMINTREKVFFFVSHWPSKLSRPDVGRDELGSTLRDSINKLYDEEGFQANIILMGDYNNEPFEEPIYDKLWATRDRNKLLEKPFLFYNPFWRNLGGTLPYCRNRETSPCHGTYYYKGSPHVTKWFTFDQIIVSSSLMGLGKWHLVEESTRAFTYESDSIFGVDFFKGHDHLPIYGKIERAHE